MCRLRHSKEKPCVGGVGRGGESGRRSSDESEQICYLALAWGKLALLTMDRT